MDYRSRFSPKTGAGIFRGAMLGFLVGLFLAALPCGATRGQGVAQVREYPPAEYYVCFRLIDQGDYVKAAQAFRSASRGGIRTSEGSWVDAICYHAMIGECFFQMGDVPQALDQFTNAVQLLVAHGNWMLRIDFPATINPRNVGPRTPISWGATTRRTTAGRFPERYPILQGQLNLLNTIRQGGVVALPEFYQVNAHEILRCGALAIRRRGEILGKTSNYDPLNEQLITLLVSRPAPPNHWSQAWVDALLGMAYSVTGRAPEAATELTKSLQIAGQFDHPLTPMALLQLGRLAFQQAQYESAATLFMEASLSAAWFEQSDVMEEAFRWGTLTHLVSGRQNISPVFEPAIAWARRQRSTLLEASLLTHQAQNAAELQQTTAASALVDQARRAMLRSEMVKGAAGARLNYVTALVAFQAGNLAAGETAWNAVAAYQTNPQRKSSQRLFEIGLVDALALSGKVTPRVANELYADVLREPTAADWSTNIVETLTTVIAPNISVYEHWLAVAKERGEQDRVLEIADRIRRLRFFSTLPVGGRVLALHWVLEATKEALPDRVTLARQDLFARYPKYAEVSRQAAQVREQLAKLPVVPENADGLKQQQQLFVELATVSQVQEVMLRELSLRREPAESVSPPALDFKQLQAKLAPSQAVLAFLLTSQNQLYGFLIRHDNCSQWRIDGANRFGKDLTELLKRMGQLDRNTPVDLAVLRTDDWKVHAADLWTKLTDGLKLESLQGVQELILVPDRWLWYVPFEALPIGDPEAPTLIQQFATRYVPTVSLAVPDGRPANIAPDLVVVASRSMPREASAVAVETAGSLRKTLGQVTQLSGPLPAPSSLFATVCRRVMVFDDVDPLARGPYDWSPIPIDRDKPGSALGTWFPLPWGAPDQLVFPSYHSMAETALKRNPTGDELFLSACGLLAMGSRTVLLSRWSTGGQASIDLAREFVQETPYSTASAAWQRSVQLVLEKDLDLAREPRVKVSDTEGGTRGSHPFFWAGHLVIDLGAVPPRDSPATTK